MAAGLPARRDPCGDYLRQATLVDFRGSILSDAGSIPAISTHKVGAAHELLPQLYLLSLGLVTRIYTILLILTLLGGACQTATAVPLSVVESSTPVATPTKPEVSLTPPAPTQTLQPAPRTFTEEFDGNMPYWSFLQIDNGQLAGDPIIDSGFLVFDLQAPNQWVYALYDGQEYADVRVDAKVEASTAGDGGLGLVCRYDEKSGWYEFNIFADQTYEILFGQWLAHGVARYTPLVRIESEKIRANVNEIGLLCEGNTLTPFINGTQMRKWQDQKIGLKGGVIGVSASSFNDIPLQIAVDWVKVSEP